MAGSVSLCVYRAWRSSRQLARKVSACACSLSSSWRMPSTKSRSSALLSWLPSSDRSGVLLSGFPERSSETSDCTAPRMLSSVGSTKSDFTSSPVRRDAKSSIERAKISSSCVRGGAILAVASSSDTSTGWGFLSASKDMKGTGRLPGLGRKGSCGAEISTWVATRRITCLARRSTAWVISGCSVFLSPLALSEKKKRTCSLVFIASSGTLSRSTKESVSATMP
mmetsp:Transcript_12391/g.31378  ORF Transcript_12391/g.31378 Transcript_12391/m.31378 type:complete len:224 (+) Transcript_12391:851-1522(+)